MFLFLPVSVGSLMYFVICVVSDALYQKQQSETHFSACDDYFEFNLDVCWVGRPRCYCKIYVQYYAINVLAY